MGILAWNAVGEVCPFEGQQIFFGFPLSTPLPLTTTKTIREKEIYLQIPLNIGFSTFESFGVFSYNEATKEVDDYEKTDTCDSFGADVRFIRLL